MNWRVLPAVCSRGADDYLTKPFNLMLLKARMISSLGKKQAHDREKQLFTELQQSYAELKKMEESRNALVNMIVHDLNNPLTIVSATCSLAQNFMETGDLDDAMLIESLQHINEASLEMVRLIRGILDVARMEHGDMPVQKAPCDVVPLVRGICDSSQSQADAAGIALTLQEPDGGMAPVQADGDLLQRVVQNLIANALKHTMEGVKVVVSVDDRGPEFVIGVADNGPGIREGDKDRLFDKFFHAEVRTQGRKYGVGMGLTFCKMAVEAQGGRIWVESEEGHGATFYVALPSA